MDGRKRPDIFHYVNYREFLRDYTDFQKKSTKGFSLRGFSLKAFSHPGLLWEVLKGKRGLSTANRLRLLETLEFSERQSAYFDLMVQQNQAKGNSRQFFMTEMAKFRGAKARVLADKERQYHTKWYNHVLFNYFSFQTNEKNATAIGKKMIPPVERERVVEAIELLLSLNLIRKTANGYSVAEDHLIDGPGMDRDLAIEIYSQFVHLAAESLPHISPEQAAYVTQVFSTNEQGLREIRQKALELQQDVRSLLDRYGKGDGVYTLNLQLFPNMKQ